MSSVQVRHWNLEDSVPQFKIRFEDLEMPETIEKLVHLINEAEKRGMLIKIVRYYDYVGDVVPAGVYRDSVSMTAVDRDEELDRIARELDREPGQATMVWDYVFTARPSEHRKFVIWLLPETRDPVDYARKIVGLIKKLDGANDAVDAYKTFIDWCNEALYTYTTRGNVAKIYDSGGDYPHGKVIVTYIG